jgi:hypothetical protein
MPPVNKKSVAQDDRNPLVLEYDAHAVLSIDAAWVAEKCMEYGVKCSHPDCDNPGTEVFITLYSCTFICAFHDARLDDTPVGKIQRVILSDLVDIDTYSSFRQRSLAYLANYANGYIRDLSKQQLKDLKKLDELERDAEHKARVAIRRLQNKQGLTEGTPAHMAYAASVGGTTWMAIEFDRNRRLEDVVIPAALVAKREFAPELYASSGNDTGLSVEDLF